MIRLTAADLAVIENAEARQRAAAEEKLLAEESARIQQEDSELVGDTSAMSDSALHGGGDDVELVAGPSPETNVVRPVALEAMTPAKRAAESKAWRQRRPGHQCRLPVIRGDTAEEAGHRLRGLRQPAACCRGR